MSLRVYGNQLYIYAHTRVTITRAWTKYTLLGKQFLIIAYFQKDMYFNGDDSLLTVNSLCIDF